jgi:hypothetical protein
LLPVLVQVVLGYWMIEDLGEHAGQFLYETMAWIRLGVEEFRKDATRGPGRASCAVLDRLLDPWSAASDVRLWATEEFVGVETNPEASDVDSFANKGAAESLDGSDKTTTSETVALEGDSVLGSFGREFA